MQKGTRLSRRRVFSVLASTPLAAGTAIMGAAVASSPAQAQSNTQLKPDAVSTQNGWRWCRKCQGLFYAPNGNGRCPAGGGHNASGSGNYALLYS